MEEKFIQKWIKDTPELLPELKNFETWFRKFRAAGGRIGKNIGGGFLLSEREFKILKHYYLNREIGKRGRKAIKGRKQENENV